MKDPVEAGVLKATRLGYGCHRDIVASILRVAESDEAEGFRVWKGAFAHDPDTFAVVLGAVREEAQRQARVASAVGTERVLEDVRAERTRQRERYGLNAATPDGTGGAWLGPYTADDAYEIEQALREDYSLFALESPVTWVHLLREEMAEAFAATDPAQLRAELVQVAALAVSWCERLDARAG